MGNKVSSAYKRHSDAKSGRKKKAVSPVPSHPSSMTSQESVSNASDIIRQGRKFHNFSESTYWLPNDEEEMDRLVGQHFALKELFGGNVLKEAYDYVKFDKRVRILDIGCGPGTWIMDVATEFPDCEFVGIDMCPVFPTNIRPPNVTFQHGNVLEGLPFQDESFDFIHLRFFMLALKRDQWAIVMKEIYRLLKPGGCLQSLEGGMMERGNEFVCWVGEVFKNVMQERGQEPYIAFKLEAIMKEANFEVIKTDQRDTYLGEKDPLNREFLWDVCNIVKSVQPFLAGPLGVAPEKYPNFLQRFYTECQKTPQAQWMIVMNLARKP